MPANASNSTPTHAPLYHRVTCHPTARISPTAGIVGDVTIGRDASIFAGVQIRGDDAPVVIGDETNLQENVVVHVDFDVPTIVGKHCTIGHGAILHGCELGDNVLVGMGAIVMNRVKIGANSVIGAGALISDGKEFPEGSLIVGMPGKLKRTLSEENIAAMCTFPGDDYVRQSGEMVEQGVLAHPAPDLCMQIGC